MRNMTTVLIGAGALLGIGMITVILALVTSPYVAFGIAVVVVGGILAQGLY